MPVQRTGRKPGLRLPKSSVRLLTREGISIINFQERFTDNCVVFICEDLAVKNMMKNRHLSKSIASVGWSQFLTMVQYKMERDGKHFRKISRWYPSSQTCGCCGYKNTDVKDLSIRKWICPKCGTWHDRDVNAQQNIYKLGVKMLQDEGIKIIDGRENRVQF